MFETDSAGAPVQIAALDPEWLLALTAESETQSRVADRRKLRYAVKWCLLHPATDGVGAEWSDAGDAELRGVDQSIAGEGAPLVAAYSAEPFAAALKVSTRSGMGLMADGLELSCRLPKIWARVEDLSVAPWRARRVAQATVALSAAAAAHVDTLLADRVDVCGSTRIDKAVAAAIATFDPDAHAEEEDKAEATWGAWVQHGVGPTWGGTSSLEIRGDTATITRFHDLMCKTAHALVDPTSEENADLNHRVVTALGLIAEGAGSPTPQTVVYVHLHEDHAAEDQDARPHGGTASKLGLVEKHGPVSVERIKSWVQGSAGAAAVKVSVRPVLDLNRTDTVDGHDPPAWMRELIILRDGECVFPHCERDARGCDLDHVKPYVTQDHGGPPGQTGALSLAPLCRRHHRAKTHGGWSYYRRGDGAYAWTDPHGHTYATLPTPAG